MTPEEAERELRKWAEGDSRRDQVVLAAHRAGVAINRIYVITGISRTTIYRILDHHQPGAAGDQQPSEGDQQ